MPVLVLLGCKVPGKVRAGGAAERRVAVAARVYGELAASAGAPPLVVVSGGRAWNGCVEADALADALVERGVPREHIVRERASHDTDDNARFTASLLARRRAREVLLVTCDWHARRARALFEREGLVVVGVAEAKSPPVGRFARLYRWGRERVAAKLAHLPVLTLAVAIAAGAGAPGCSKGATLAGDAGGDAGASAASATESAKAIARAEDLRRAADVTPERRTSHVVDERRRAARALARIADDASEPGLLRALSDEDDEVAAWGAYGLGFGCKGKEDAHVSALVARAAGLGDRPRPPGSRLDVRAAIARAIGHCAGGASEPTLVAWLRARGPFAEQAGYALGDVASRRGALGAEATTALLEVAVGGAAGPLVPSAIYPFSRVKSVDAAFVPRLGDAVRAALGHPAAERIFAVRALGRCGAPAVADLVKIADDRSGFTPAERAEAARTLGSLEAPGQRGAVQALAALVPDAKDALGILKLAGDEESVLTALLDVVHGDVPAADEASLFALARLAAPGEPPPPLARRLARLRCSAAAVLAKGSFDSDVLTSCDAKGSEAWERGRLTSLLRRPLTGARRAAWLEIATKSEHVRVREAALEAIADHPELADAGRAAVAAALRSKVPGVVTTAAEVVKDHPDRAGTVSRSERRAALDPSAPAPTGPASHELDPQIGRALVEALAAPWSEDLVETRLALFEAAVAVAAPGAREAVLAACKDSNATVHEHALKAIAAIDATATPQCTAAPPGPASSAPEIEHPLARAVKLALDTDAGALGIRLDPALAPITAARIAGLARAGFYKGIVVHRVVPGFVAQFGDPGGDGYGGSGKLLRCETSPISFGALDVGMALAGRDTGSSQLFVTLAPTPRLDGEYTQVGHAEGDWAALAEGDVIRDVKVREE